MQIYLAAVSRAGRRAVRRRRQRIIWHTHNYMFIVVTEALCALCLVHGGR